MKRRVSNGIPKKLNLDKAFQKSVIDLQSIGALWTIRSTPTWLSEPRTTDTPNHMRLVSCWLFVFFGALNLEIVSGTLNWIVYFTYLQDPFKKKKKISVRFLLSYSFLGIFLFYYSFIVVYAQSFPHSWDWCEFALGLLDFLRVVPLWILYDHYWMFQVSQTWQVWVLEETMQLLLREWVPLPI